jgi:LAO/AO transport system kinase
MPGTGDELQGIKRGIMEAADIIVINKADGEYLNAAMRAKKQLEMALHLFPSSQDGWETKVLTTSSLAGEGINKVWETIQKMQHHLSNNGYFESKRSAQQIMAFEKLTALSIYEYVMQEMGKHADVQALKTEISVGKINEFQASLQVLKTLGQLKIQ